MSGRQRTTSLVDPTGRNSSPGSHGGFRITREWFALLIFMNFFYNSLYQIEINLDNWFKIQRKVQRDPWHDGRTFMGQSKF